MHTSTHQNTHAHTRTLAHKRVTSTCFHCNTLQYTATIHAHQVSGTQAQIQPLSHTRESLSPLFTSLKEACQKRRIYIHQNTHPHTRTQESHSHLFSLPWKRHVKKRRVYMKRDVYTYTKTHTHTHTHIRESLAPLVSPLKETCQQETYAREKRPITEGSFTSFLYVFYLFSICFVYIPEPHTCVWVCSSFHISQE